jgi:glyoxylase-like metal-dependent hydrolase (beta-lactamase superfamily II)
VREVRKGVWHWQAPHPAWKPGDDWDRVLSSYAIDDGARLLLFDPLAPPSEIDELAAGRETAIVLTCPWHVRDARSLAERLGAPLYVPPPDEGEPNPVEAHVFSAGDRLPVRVQAFPGMEPNDLVLWIESRRALVAGDTLIDRGRGLEFPVDWANKGVPPERILETQRPLLGLPVELALLTHGSPTDRAALEPRSSARSLDAPDVAADGRRPSRRASTVSLRQIGSSGGDGFGRHERSASPRAA